jgi:Rrf2 family protein
MRMRINRRGDYAVRAVLALADSDRLLATPELAERMNIPVTFLPQIMPGLVRARIVERRLGRHGGYRLARPAASISLLEVIEAADPAPDRRPTCILRGDGCNPDAPCRVHPAVAGASDAMRVALAGADFASLRDTAQGPM